MKYFISILTILLCCGTLTAQTRLDQAPPNPPQPQGQLGWQRVPFDTNMAIAIGYISRDTCYAFNQHSFYRSLDAGQTWQRVQWVPNPSSFKFVDGSHGIVTYFSNQTCFRTTDAGQTWIQANNQVDQAIYVDFVSRDTAFIAGSENIGHTYDGGKTWARSTIPAPIYGIAFYDGQHGIAVGETMPGPVPHTDITAECYTTSDAGKIWVQQYTGRTSSLRGVTYISKDTLIAFGGPRQLCLSTDGGKLWDSIVAPFIDRNHGLIDVSSHGGRTIAVGSLGLIVCSTDGGRSWQTQQSAVTSDLASISMADQFLAIAGGDSGVIIRTENGGTDWVQIAPNSSQTLVSQSFPEPSHGLVSLSVTLPQLQHVIITIVDITGRIVATAVDRQLVPAGVHQFPIDASAYPPGTYSYTIQTERFQGSGKFTIVR